MLMLAADEPETETLLSRCGHLFYAIAADITADLCFGTDVFQVAVLHFDFYSGIGAIGAFLVRQ